jgi:hypothetical protein
MSDFWKVVTQDEESEPAVDYADFVVEDIQTTRAKGVVISYSSITANSSYTGGIAPDVPSKQPNEAAKSTDDTANDDSGESVLG